MTNKKKIFKKFLLSKNTDFFSHAISKIHLTYRNYERKENLNTFLTFIKKFFYIFDEKNVFYKSKINTDVIIISNVVSIQSIKKDFYFGKLADLLRKEKIKVLTVYRNHTSLNSKVIKNLLNKKSILLSKRASYLNETIILFNYLAELFIFIFLKKYSPIKKYIKIRDLLAIISNLRLIFQLDKVLDVYQPKVIIFTYEGHAWERLLVFLCNNRKKKIKSIATQFSLIKKNQVGFFTELKKKYNPDYIATTGNIPTKIIKKKN